MLNGTRYAYGLGNNLHRLGVPIAEEKTLFAARTLHGKIREALMKWYLRSAAPSRRR